MWCGEAQPPPSFYPPPPSPFSSSPRRNHMLSSFHLPLLQSPTLLLSFCPPPEYYSHRPPHPPASGCMERRREKVREEECGWRCKWRKWLQLFENTSGGNVPAAEMHDGKVSWGRRPVNGKKMSEREREREKKSVSRWSVLALTKDWSVRRVTWPLTSVHQNMAAVMSTTTTAN